MNIEDPTELYCLESSLTQKELTYITSDVIIKQNIKTGQFPETLLIDENIVDKDRYTLLNEIQDTYLLYPGTTQDVNPFENISNLTKNTFIDRAGIKIANIDAIFNITESNYSYLRYIHDEEVTPDSKRYTFYDLAGGPGAFSEYVFFRRPFSVGYGMTLKSDRLDWDEILINGEKQYNFTVDYGQSNDGNLFYNIDYLDNKFKNTKLDLVVADGALSAVSREVFQELDTVRIVLTESIIALKILDEGKNYICKIFGSVSPIMRDILFTLSCCFDKFYIFKPISSRPANAERYIIGKGLKNYEKIKYYISILENVVKEFENGNFVYSIYDVNDIPKDIIEYIRFTNMYSIERQIKYGKLSIEYMLNQNLEKVKYDLLNALILWNIPFIPPKDKVKKHIIRQKENIKKQQILVKSELQKIKFNIPGNPSNYKPIIILDIDGVLAYRKKKDILQEVAIGNKFIYPRIGVKDLIKSLFDKYQVAIFTSITKKNADPILEYIFTKEQYNNLLFKWYRNKTKEDKTQLKDGEIDEEEEDDERKDKYRTVKLLIDIINDPIINYDGKLKLEDILMIDDSERKMRMNDKKNYIIINSDSTYNVSNLIPDIEKKLNNLKA